MKLLYLGAGALTAAVAALVTVLSTAGCGSAPPSAQSAAWVSPDSMTTVVTVNGQGVPVRELELFLAQDRAATFAYFQQKYNDNDRPGFWTTGYGGQTPQDYLRKAAIADATRATVTLQLGRTSGLLADPGYAAFLQSLNAENAQRRQALRDQSRRGLRGRGLLQHPEIALGTKIVTVRIVLAQEARQRRLRCRHPRAALRDRGRGNLGVDLCHQCDAARAIK